MINSGSIAMPLHFGKVPSFLTERMGKMGDAVIESIVDNYGKSEVLTRMSDPNWFQAFGAVMGMPLEVFKDQVSIISEEVMPSFKR